MHASVAYDVQNSIVLVDTSSVAAKHRVLHLF